MDVVLAESCVRSVVFVIVWLPEGVEQWMKRMSAKGSVEHCGGVGSLWEERADCKMAFRAGMLRRRKMGRL